MPTCRLVIADALRALKVMAPGDMTDIDELNAGLAGLQNLILELHEAKGALQDIDIPGAMCPQPPSGDTSYVANENQRVRVQAGFTATVTLPNSVPIWPTWDPYDYGFIEPPFWSAPGSTGEADNVAFRQPADGARIEIVGTTQGLWFYRADVNAWAPAYGLTLDTEVPLNQRYAGPLGAMLAERLMDEMAVAEPTPALARRIVNARAVMFTRPGAKRRSLAGQYF